MCNNSSLKLISIFILLLICICHIIVNRIIHGLEAYLQNNGTHCLCYCPGLCKNRYLSHHVPILFLRKQPIAECWTRLFMHNGNNWPN